jgi:hypothetical protein
MADRKRISASGDMPLRVTGEAVMYLSSLSQFHGIPDSALIHLAERRTRIYVPDRWVAIALILSNRIPIPVPTLHGQVQGNSSEDPALAKLEVIIGGRVPR